MSDRAGPQAMEHNWNGGGLTPSWAALNSAGLLRARREVASGA